MYNVTAACRAAIERPERTERLTGQIALAGGEAARVIPLTDSVLKSGTVKLDNQCVNGEELEFGAVYAGQLTFSLDDKALTIDRYALYGAAVTLVWGI